MARASRHRVLTRTRSEDSFDEKGTAVRQGTLEGRKLVAVIATLPRSPSAERDPEPEWSRSGKAHKPPERRNSDPRDAAGSMRLTLTFFPTPTPLIRDMPDDGLSAGVDVHVLDPTTCSPRRSLVSASTWGVKVRRSLVATVLAFCRVTGLSARFVRVINLHRDLVGRVHLDGEHGLELVLGPDPVNRGEGSIEFRVAGISLALFARDRPEAGDYLIGESGRGRAEGVELSKQPGVDIAEIGRDLELAVTVDAGRSADQLERQATRKEARQGIIGGLQLALGQRLVVAVRCCQGSPRGLGGAALRRPRSCPHPRAGRARERPRAVVVARDGLDALGHRPAHELAHGDALGVGGTPQPITQAARGARPDLVRVAAGVPDERVAHGPLACDLTRERQNAPNWLWRC